MNYFAAYNSDMPPVAQSAHDRQPRRGFTLVELLLVIALIALLIAFLLPSVSIARQSALRTACAAKLQQIVLAAQLHAMEHHGYYPLAGTLPGWTPAALDDTYSTKYEYFDFSLPYQKIPAPITFSLGLEMTQRHVMDSSKNAVLGPLETDPQGLIRNFLCPAQATSVTELYQNPDLYVCGTAANTGAVGYNQALSYNFNEAVCGWADPHTGNRLRGRASLVRQPTSTFFACDGLMGAPDPYDQRVPFDGTVGMATLYNINPNPPVTMTDALTGDGKAGDPQNFDHPRHRGKINIGFCDGHVESRFITPSDLATVYLLAP